MLDGEKIDEYIKQIDAEKDEEADKKKTKKWGWTWTCNFIVCQPILSQLNTRNTFSLNDCRVIVLNPWPPWGRTGGGGSGVSSQCAGSVQAGEGKDHIDFTTENWNK